MCVFFSVLIEIPSHNTRYVLCSGSNDTCCLACLFLFFLPCLSLCSLIFPPCRPYAGISFHVFVLFRPCSSYLFLLSTYVVLLAAFLILRHTIQNSCRLFFFYLFFSSFSAFCRYLLPRLPCCFARAAVICPSSARILSFLQPFRSSCITFFRTPVGFFVFFVIIFLIFLVWLVFSVFSYQVR